MNSLNKIEIEILISKKKIRTIKKIPKTYQPGFGFNEHLNGFFIFLSQPCAVQK